MKFLTIRQPWASLIAVGAKTIETRPFSTTYRGPLAIHAGKALPTIDPVHGSLRLGPCRVYDTWADQYEMVLDGGSPHPLPLGAVVAVCDLVDVAPIVDGSLGWQGPGETPECAVVLPWSGGLELIDGPNGRDLDDQLPFGDFTPGRYAWLLDNVRPIDPVPMKGAQGLRDVPDEIAAQIEAAL